MNVTPGSTSLRATIGSPSDPAADLDLYVYNCTTGSCVLAGQSADGDAEESVTIANPAPGAWVTLVDGFAVPSGTTTFNYVDVFTNPAFGSVAVTDSNALRPANSQWTVPATVTANSVPAAGRVLLGNVRVAHRRQRAGGVRRRGGAERHPVAGTSTFRIEGPVGTSGGAFGRPGRYADTGAAGSATGCPAGRRVRAASTEPSRISGKPTTMPRVSRSPSTSTPSSSATAGLT